VIGWLTAKNCRNKILKKVFAGQKAEKFILRPLSVAERGLFCGIFLKYSRQQFIALSLYDTII